MSGLHGDNIGNHLGTLIPKPASTVAHAILEVRVEIRVGIWVGGM